VGRLEDKVCIVTGAGQGIGRGIARCYAREGARVLVAEIDPETGPRTVEELEALGARAAFIQTDVGDRDQVEAMVEAAASRWGRIDVLVNNAWSSRGPGGRIEWTDDDTMDAAWKVGFLSSFWSMKASFPHMKAQGGGSIINLCSLNGVNAHMYTVHYNTAKEALRSLTRTAAVEWGRHQIRCNVICPAAATESYVAFRKANPETAAVMLEQNPMGRMGDPERDIGGIALFLASDDSLYLSGNTLFADGASHVNGVSWKPELPEDLPT
jgi:NAD(P)-dependent dehydrogenase (short-subunit alcohol dehydrogenase family)